MSASQIIQVVRPHVPLIRFPQRLKVIQNGLGKVGSLESVSAKKAVSPAATGSKVIGSSVSGSGIDFKDLPRRYQRKPLEQLEIDFITRGGPEK